MMYDYFYFSLLSWFIVLCFRIHYIPLPYQGSVYSKLDWDNPMINITMHSSKKVYAKEWANPFVPGRTGWHVRAL